MVVYRGGHRCLEWGAPLSARSRVLAFFWLYLLCRSRRCGRRVRAGWLTGRGSDVEANAALQRWWTGMLFSATQVLFAVRIEAEGVDVVREGPMLLFVRHTSTADTVLAAAFVANPHRLLLKYVLKRELLWDPCLDIVGRRLPNAFVDRSAPRAEGEVAAVAALAKGLDARSAALIYPEGTRPEAPRSSRRSVAWRCCEKALLPLAQIAENFRFVLPPRLGGLALLDAAPGVDVVILEHTGLEGAASFGRFWTGALVGKTLRVRLRRIPASQIPAQGRDVWLFERWAEMDAWLAAGAATAGNLELGAQQLEVRPRQGPVTQRPGGPT